MSADIHQVFLTLLAEGVPVLDPKYQAITLFVTNASTKLLQTAQREAQKAE